MSNIGTSKARKILTVAFAAAALGGAMIATSGEAFAGGNHGHGHGGHHGHFSFHGGHFKNFYYDGFYSYGGPDCYYVKKWRRGYMELIKVCDRTYF